MSNTWSRTSTSTNRADTAEHAIAARLHDHGIVSTNAIVTGYVVAAQTATFDHDGSVVEQCAWIPSAGLSVESQIELLERTLEFLRRRSASS
jgi:hypothetical protein